MRRQKWCSGWYWLVTLVVLWPVAPARAAADREGTAAMTAEAVMRAVDDRYQGESRRQQGTLTLIDKYKKQRVREFVEHVKKFGKDEKTVSRVLAPAEVKGTAFLSYEWKDRRRDDESWLYLPELRKVKRLASTDKSGYFLGSDFAYWDLTGLEIDDFDYVFVDDEPKERDVWVILATPKPAAAERVIDETKYLKVKYWVDKQRLITLKAQYWLNEGQRIKYYSASHINEVSSIPTVHKMQMVMTQSGQMIHASVYELAKIDYNVPISDQEFTTYALERPVN